jgi:hypothetical protein
MVDENERCVCEESSPTQLDFKKLTESQWAAVRATLPPDVDEVWFRSELERIASETLPPKRLYQIYLERAERLQHLIRDLPDLEYVENNDALREQLRRQQEHEKDRADFYRRMAEQKQPKRFLQYCFILDLWERAGGHLPIKTPYKKRDARRSPLPTGPVIPYLQAVATAIWGKAPGAHQVKDTKSRYQRRFKRTAITSFSHVTIDERKIRKFRRPVSPAGGG